MKGAALLVSSILSAVGSNVVHAAGGPDLHIAVRSVAVAIDDEAKLGELIGDATVVALSEPIHCAAEPLEFRNKLIEYLVRAKGFTAVAIESGLVESKSVHDFVRAGRGELPTILRSGFSWTFDALPQNLEMVRWIRDYNLKHPARPINFYGFDIPGSPGNPAAQRGMDTALVEALRYLDRVDAPAARAFENRLAPLLPSLKFGLAYTDGQAGYHRLDQASRDTLTALIADLNTYYDRHEAAFIADSSEADYAWARQAAIGARQTDAWAREIPVGWSAPSQAYFLSRAVDVRDRAMADNLEWILDREGSAGKILIFGHRYHLSAAPVIASWWPAKGAERPSNAVMGTYLRTRLGGRLLTIGALNGAGTVACGPEIRVINPPPSQSIEAVLTGADSSPYLVDLRKAPATVVEVLEGIRDLGQGEDAMLVNILRAFDVLYSAGKLTPAVFPQ